MTFYASLSISLDGYYTGPNPSAQQMLGGGGEVLHDWLPKNPIDRRESGAHDIVAAEFTQLGGIAPWATQ